MRTIMFLLIVSTVAVPACLAQPIITDPAEVDRDQRAEELQELRFGMFVCWSFSTFCGYEWTPGVEDINFFNPTGFDPDQWCRVAKEAGMKYILFLTKHHDGFCLWDTKTTDRKVTNTKALKGVDVLAEVKKACDKHGLKLALYFSEGDWSWSGRKDIHKSVPRPEIKKAQLKELLTLYGPIEYIWMDHAINDGGLSHEETSQFCKSLQPGCFIGFNSGAPAGDLRIGERGKPTPVDDLSGVHGNRHAIWKDYKGWKVAEFTYPILEGQGRTKTRGAQWFYSLPENDERCVSAEKIYSDYLASVECKNIFSLDVGPDRNGRIRAIDVKTLKEVGKAIAGHGHSSPPRQIDLGKQIDRWDEAVPLGNGMTGSLLWGGKDELRFSMDRGDLWDLRAPKELSEPGFNYANIQKLVKEKNQAEINRLFDNIYNQKVPTKLPGARIVIKLETPDIEAFNLNLDTGTGQVALDSGSQVEAFWIPGKPVMMVRIPTDVNEIILVPNTSVKALGYPAAKIAQGDDSVLLNQPGLEGFSYAIGVVWRSIPGGIELAASMDSRQDGGSSAEKVEARCRAALRAGWEASKHANDRWWKDFWATSDVKVPDKAIQKQYDLAMYYYGAGSRKGCPPLPLQGVWTADQGGLPPWKGDYHHDMNTQVIYCAYYAAGHFKAGESLLDFMVDLTPTHRKFSKDFFGVDGLMVPGVMSFDGSPLGGWTQYALSPTMGPWLYQNFDWHWRYTQDKELLTSTIYPYGKEMAKSIEGLLIEDANGKLKLPLSTSPEIHNNSLGAWLTPNSNNDLATLIWFFDALAQQADALGKTADAAHFRAMLPQFEPLAVDPETKVLMLDPVQRLKQSHRHHAHLMAIQPLEVMTIEDGEKEKEIIINSLDDLRRIGTQAWVGFSFPWAASLEARAGRGDMAEKYLSIFANAFVSPNGFNLNGDQSGKGYSGFRYRPFTLDANFGHALAVQEMCLQSWHDTLRIFPAIPWKWHNASFRDFRTEGAHTVSGRWENNATTWFKITAGKDGPLRIRNIFGNRKIKWSCRGIQTVGQDFVITAKKGDVIEATLKKPTTIPPKPALVDAPLLLPKPWMGLVNNDLPLRIGADSGGTNTFKGHMMDIGVYDRALTQAEVIQLVTREIKPKALANAVVVPGAKKLAETTLVNLANDKLPIVLKGNMAVEFPAGKGTNPIYAFDGKSWLEVADHPSIKGKKGITLSAWINTKGPIPGNGMRLLDKSPTGSAKGYLFDTYPNGKALRFTIKDPALTAKADIPLGLWTHVAATVDGKTGKQTLYLNGKKVGER